MPKTKVLVFALVSVVLLGAVIAAVFVFSNKEETDETDTTVTTKKDESNTVANAPAGCPSSTSIVVKSDEAGTQNISAVNSNFLHWRDDQALLVFTNYTLNPESVYSDITGDNVLTVIKLSHEDETSLALGTFRKNTVPASEEDPNQFASEFNISTEGLAGAVFDDASTVEISYLGTDYVCGTVQSDDGSSSIKGDFIAKYIDQR